MRIAINSNTTGKFTRKMVNGRNHIITPMIPIKGDISMNGIYYPLDEVKKSFNQLHDLPAPNGHPTVNGVHVSASKPAAMNSHNIGGFVRDPKMNEKTVMVDFMLDEVVANQTDDGKELIKRIENGEKIGVSTGLNIDQVENKSGKDDFGMKYNRIGYGFHFDHVAILLNEKAAGDHAGTELKVNELDTGNPEDPIFVVNLLQSNDTSIEVERKTEFLTTTNEGENMDKQKLVLAIIGMTTNAFSGSDFERLMALDEKDLVNELAVNTKQEVTTEDAKELLANSYDFEAFEVFNKEAEDFKTFKANQEAFNTFLAAKDEEIKTLKEEIIAANADYTEELLSGKSVDELTIINKMAKVSKTPKRIPQGSAPNQTNSLQVSASDYVM